MRHYPKLSKIDKFRAENEVGESLTIGEAFCVLDALANGDDPLDHLEEYRYWQSPHGRNAAYAEAWDSGRY